MVAKKLIGKLHLWLGLASGLVVFIVSITGCLYAFIDEIRPVVYNNRLRVESTGRPTLPVSQLRQIAQRALGVQYPINRVDISGASDRSWAFGASQSIPGALTYFGETKYNYTVYVNPYTGRVLEIENSEYEFFSLVLWIHWSLLLSNDIGQPIVGTAVLVFVILLLTGLVLWWPKNKVARKQRFSVKWNASGKRLNYDLHNIFGFYALTFGLMVSLTGLVWAFPWLDKAVYFAATGGGSPAVEKPVLSDTTAAAVTLPLDRIVADARTQSPTARELYVSLPTTNSEVIYTYARLGQQVNYKGVSNEYDQHTARRLSSKRFEDGNRGEKVRSLNYDLHVGSILGLPGKILAFFASFICASLPITGFLIWWGRRKKKGKLRVTVKPTIHHSTYTPKPITSR